MARGMIVDLAVHEGKAENEEEPDNPHFHVLVPIRPFTEEGIWGNKKRREYIPVSYTHLDVYKRQAEFCKVFCNYDWYAYGVVKHHSRFIRKSTIAEDGTVCHDTIEKVTEKHFL